MSQQWPSIDPPDIIRDSRQDIVDRDETLKSQFEGPSFPVTNLIIGMPCYRSDLLQEFYLESTGPSVWIPRPNGGVGGILPILQGGTGAANATDARTNLGLGGLAVLSSVDTSELVDSAVTTAKIEADAIDSTKIADNAVGIEHMQDDSVDTAELVDGAVTLVKLDSGINLGLPAGTRAFFNQTAAPTGWTKDTTHNNKAIRIVSGSVSSGGSVGFTTALGSPSVTGGTISGTVGSHTLTLSEIPSHSHDLDIPRRLTAGGGGANIITDVANTTATIGTASQGGGGGHTHPAGGTLSGASTPINVQFVDTIIAVKD